MEKVKEMTQWQEKTGSPNKKWKPPAFCLGVALKQTNEANHSNENMDQKCTNGMKKQKKSTKAKKKTKQQATAIH
jgi:hypothetical protein